MDPTPLLSICIPCYNRPQWFQRALISIREYSGENVEVVITDDSDHDQNRFITEETLRGWSGLWRYEHHPQRLGMVENWNRSLQWANGEFTIILHDDDYFVSNGLDRLVSQLHQSCAYPVMLFGVRVVDANERLIKYQRFQHNQWLDPRQALRHLLTNSSFVRFPGIVIKRQLFAELGYFDSAWKEPCDLEMWMRLFSHYGVFCYRSVTVAYRVHSQALTMGMFQQETVKTLIRLFKDAKRLNTLTPTEINSYQRSFLHQYVLAGAWRQLRRGRWHEFQQVMELFALPELKDLTCPMKWWLVKSLFLFLTRVLPS